MYVLKDRRCSICGNYIEVHSCRDKNERGEYTTVVDHGSCVFCGKIDILPTEHYQNFVRQFCISI